MELHRILNDDEHVEHVELSGVVSPAPSVPSQGSTHGTVRVGKWTLEEEQFAMLLIKYFSIGMLPIATGTSLRSFLAKKLRCSPMRISTKLSMDSLAGEPIPKKLGQRRFFPCETSPAQRQQIAAELSQLELAFLRKEHLELEIEELTLDSPRSDSEASDPESNSPVRMGSWSDVEQVYAAALIDAFLRGLLDLPQGTTLRAFLAECLCCNPMRISKKLATGMIANQALPKRLGSAAFQPARDVDPAEYVAVDRVLSRLRADCFSARTEFYDQASSSPIYSPQSQCSPMTVSPIAGEQCGWRAGICGHS